MIQLLFVARRERRERVERDAAELLTFLSDMAYPEARTRAREARARRERSVDRHWSRVAVEIASRTGRVIGTRLPTDMRRRATASEAALRLRVAPGLASTLADIAAGIADLAHGRADETTVHNVGARVRHVIEMGGSASAFVVAGDHVIAACEDLERAEFACRADVEAGRYPEATERVGCRLQAFSRLAQRRNTSAASAPFRSHL